MFCDGAIATLSCCVLIFLEPGDSSPWPLQVQCDSEFGNRADNFLIRCWRRFISHENLCIQTLVLHLIPWKICQNKDTCWFVISTLGSFAWSASCAGPFSSEKYRSVCYIDGWLDHGGSLDFVLKQNFKECEKFNLLLTRNVKVECSVFMWLSLMKLLSKTGFMHIQARLATNFSYLPYSSVSFSPFFPVFWGWYSDSILKYSTSISFHLLMTQNL